MTQSTDKLKYRFIDRTPSAVVNHALPCTNKPFPTTVKTLLSSTCSGDGMPVAKLRNEQLFVALGRLLNGDSCVGALLVHPWSKERQSQRGVAALQQGLVHTRQTGAVLAGEVLGKRGVLFRGEGRQGTPVFARNKKTTNLMKMR